ncbi:Uncharacterised protein [Bordetella trematum]|uniref:hypothetical protein n=1 Tax=Bordetella trematum TaxID=123899 RepID=UPI00046F46C6|nr:hypothetical protein [Bordetella trematum]AUL48159.1 hypothetical protein BTL55_15230 [Bordetella trematum]QIM70069.1 hypothetical protein EYB34_01085 [Bordetella trematum]SAI55104.1 Uncharacterised protein [Bordetella trematum]
MDFTLTLLMVFIAWQVLRVRYQRNRIALLGQHLSSLQLERHMETLTQGYARAIHEQGESRQLQILETFAPTERGMASQARALANSMAKEPALATRVSTFTFCVPYVERVLPAATRDFRELLQIHAAGLRYAVDNEEQWDPKTRAFHLSAELYLLQHSCHWFCKSRGVADARLLLRHKVDHQKVLDSVSPPTRRAYLNWLGRHPT